MDKREAYQILGINSDDGPDEIRRKYHLLMHVYHPDAAGQGDPVDLEMPKKLNEAFRFLKREGFFLKNKAIQDWGIRENDSAFCKRRIYMEDDLFGDKMILDTGAVGRFYWDPELEPFSLLLKSIGEAVSGLMEEAARTAGDVPKKTHMRFGAKLLHLLLQEYVDPYECIRFACPSGQRDREDENVYRLRCHLKPDRGWMGRRYRASECSVRAQESRLLAYAGEEKVGQITFEQDYLYYVVTPLFLQGAATARLCVEEGHSSYLSAELVLHIDPRKKRDMTSRINLEIAETMKRYDEYLKG